MLSLGLSIHFLSVLIATVFLGLSRPVTYTAQMTSLLILRLMLDGITVILSRIIQRFNFILQYLMTSLIDLLLISRRCLSYPRIPVTLVLLPSLFAATPLCLTWLAVIDMSSSICSPACLSDDVVLVDAHILSYISKHRHSTENLGL